MNLIEILQAIKQAVLGLVPYPDPDYVRRLLKELHVEPKTIIVYFYKEGISHGDVIDLLKTLDFNANDVLEAYVSAGLAYSDLDFVRTMEGKFGRDATIEAYRNSSLDEFKVKRLMLDAYGDAIEKAEFVRKDEKRSVRRSVLAYIEKGHRQAAEAERMLLEAVRGIGTDEDDGNVAYLAKDFSADNTAALVEYLTKE